MCLQQCFIEGLNGGLKQMDFPKEKIKEYFKNWIIENANYKSEFINRSFIGGKNGGN